MPGILCISTIFANESKIILFYTGWHAKTHEAKAVCRQLSDNFHIQFQEYNIDRLSTQKEIENARLKVPSAVPYIYVLDQKGNIIYKNLYQAGSADEIELKIKEYFN